MEKVQTARVIEFYSNSCMVRLGDMNIPCLTPKRLDVVVGDEVEIDVINDSSETVSYTHLTLPTMQVV